MPWNMPEGRGSGHSHKHQVGRNKQPRSSQRGNQGLGGGQKKQTGNCLRSMLPAVLRLPLVMWRHRHELGAAMNEGYAALHADWRTLND